MRPPPQPLPSPLPQARRRQDIATAKTDEQRELVATRIEEDAAAEAALLLVSNSYLPPLTTTGPRDGHCSVRSVDPPPMEYPFKVK